MRAFTATVTAASRRFVSAAPSAFVAAAVALAAFILVAPSVASATTTAVLEARFDPSYPVETYGMSYFGERIEIEDGAVIVGDTLLDKASVFTNSGGAWAETEVFDLDATDLDEMAFDGTTLVTGRRFGVLGGRVYPVADGNVDANGVTAIEAWGVAVDGDLMVTSTSQDIRVYRRTGTWQQVASIPITVGGRFQAPAVAVSGNTIAYADDLAASVFICTLQPDNTVTQQLWLPGGEVVPGARLSMSGDTLVIGAGEHISVYRGSEASWHLEASLVPSGVSAYSGYGRALDIDGDTILVGAPYDDLPDTEDYGSVFVFRRQGTEWSEALKVLSEGCPEIDQNMNLRGPAFGAGVAVDGDRIAIGGFQETVNGWGTGAAYVYRLSETGYPQGWMQPPAYLYLGWANYDDYLLGWRNPRPRVGFHSTRVAQRIGTAPTGPDDPNAQILYEGTAETFLNPTMPPGAPVHFAAWSRNVAGDWSETTRLFVAVPPDLASAWIPVGDNVTVSAGGVTLTFPRVTRAGQLNVSRSYPLRTPPNGRRWVADGYLDIHPGAIFEGPVEVTVDFDAGDAQRPETLRLDHWNGTAWERISSGGANGGSITGMVSSFSEFGVNEASGESSATPIVSSPASTGWSVGMALLAMAAAVWFGRRRSAPEHA